MARLTFASDTGGIAAEITTPDANALTIVDDYIAANGAEPASLSNQEKAEAFMDSLRSHILNTVRTHRVNRDVRLSREAARDAAALLAWEGE